MNTTLGETLEQLAQDAVGDVSLNHPALVAEHRAENTASPRLSLALTMAALIVAVVGMIWWVQRDTSNELRTTTSIASLPIPSILREEPIPLTELSPNLAQAFEAREVRGPLLELTPDAPLLIFDGVHRVEQDGLVVAVGLDRSGRMICLAQEIASQEGTSSGCVSTAGFLANGVNYLSTTTQGGLSLAVAFVNDGVVSLEMGELSTPVTRNIGVFNSTVNDVLVARMADGSSKPLSSIPSGSPIAKLTVDGLTTTEVVSAGCSLVDNTYLVEVNFVGESTLLTATVTPDAIRIGGTLGKTPINVLTDSADIALDQVEETFVLNATWQSADSSGSLTANCGQNILDLSSIR